MFEKFKLLLWITHLFHIYKVQVSIQILFPDQIHKKSNLVPRPCDDNNFEKKNIEDDKSNHKFCQTNASWARIVRSNQHCSSDHGGNLIYDELHNLVSQMEITISMFSLRIIATLFQLSTFDTFRQRLQQSNVNRFVRYWITKFFCTIQLFIYFLCFVSLLQNNIIIFFI